MTQYIGPFALAVALGLAGLNGCTRFGGDPPSRPITLTLLHTNDTHSHLEPFPRDDELSAGNQGPQQGGIPSGTANQTYCWSMPVTISRARSSTTPGKARPRSWR